MIPTVSLISKLNPQYFWDVNLAGLDENSAYRLIIQRVFSLGEIYEMKQVIGYYGRGKVIDVLCNLAYLDPKTLNFVSKLFHKSIKAFRCYQISQLRPQLWNS
jgi:hypothetical protein